MDASTILAVERKGLDWVTQESFNVREQEGVSLKERIGACCVTDSPGSSIGVPISSGVKNHRRPPRRVGLNCLIPCQLVQVVLIEIQFLGKKKGPTATAQLVPMAGLQVSLHRVKRVTQAQQNDVTQVHSLLVSHLVLSGKP
jgi:hypothetical protein